MPVLQDDQDVTFIKFCRRDPKSIDQTTYQLKQSSFLNDVTYKLYYLVLEKAQELLLVMWMVF
jgi:hypothetical protein